MPVRIKADPERKPEEAPHEPRWRFDCGRCKFSWCCGMCCHCNLRKTDYPDTPDYRKLEVAQARWDWRTSKGYYAIHKERPEGKPPKKWDE